ncbi:flavin oxidoreductase [Flavobacterium sp. IMCC34852]|uniref:Flavin oxidoreductase n=1 Tax=Flavobacterium rivulicola TaxID=2732161 RepID=A0A7Y3VXJ9_9FLAO|nr:flavin reductase [Flavobacterium sp. IMCC34852]NNT70607.1 flavin oxidoreductase [Flavobacterium sp. IMCC34852]
MKKITQKELAHLSKIQRLNLINSCTGYKSANLIGTKSIKGNSNVAVFSSVTHLGSNPAMLGFILRPNVVARNTYDNLKSNGYFTVNHIAQNIIAQAHQTSASYNAEESEFEIVNLTEEYLSEIDVPFVEESPVKLLCKYLNEYEIKENNTIHIIASIEEIYFKEAILHEDYWLQLDKADVVTVNGLDGYCLPKVLDRFDYARPHLKTKSILKNGA